jgi:hypothetical protein
MQVPIIHNRLARNISFALDENSPEKYRRNLIGDH